MKPDICRVARCSWTEEPQRTTDKSSIRSDKEIPVVSGQTSASFALKAFKLVLRCRRKLVPYAVDKLVDRHNRRRQKGRSRRLLRNRLNRRHMQQRQNLELRRH